MSLRIDQVTVLDPAPAGTRVLEDVSVYVADGLVEEIGSSTPEADRVIDGGGGLLLPGLVNAHGHAPMTLFRGYADDLELESWLRDRIWPAEAHLTRDRVLAGARLACAEMIEAGITAFADMYLFEDAVLQAAREAGLACLAGASIVDQPTAEGTPDQVLANARDLIDEHPPGEGRLRASLAPHSVYACGPETLQAVAQTSRETRAPIQIHVAETRREVYEAERKRGARPVALLDEHGCLTGSTVLAHGGWLTKGEARRLGEAGTSLAHCPTANQKLATGGITPLPELFEAGVSVGLGTDGPASNNRIDVLQEAKRASLIQKHHRWEAQLVPAEKALAMATREGAGALGFGDAGRVCEGAWADLVLLDTDRPHLAPVHDPVSQAIYAAQAGDVQATIAGGDVLYHEGEHRALELAEILEEARRAACELVEQAEAAS